ncbi:MAG: hypothetical protein IPH31_13555 [Lewinellaceae bacterium]|nr:hypothetical protein [Lewinellaceae bacterium]
MHNSDLVELLTTLREDEKKRLKVFLETAELGTPVRAEAVRMVDYILANLGKEENDQALAKSEAYVYIFPEKEIVANKLEKSMSDTLHLVRWFVAHESAGQNMTELQQAFYLQKFYNERNLEKKFQQSRKQFGKLKSTHREWSPQDYYFQFLSESEEYVFQSDRNQKKDDLNLWNSIQALDEYYLVERLWHTCILLNQNQLAPLALPPLDEWVLFDLKSPRFRWFFEKPIGQLFTQAIDLLSDESYKSGQKLTNFVKLIGDTEPFIWKTYVSTFEIFACNYGIRRLNKGHAEYANPVFQLQKRRVESGRIYMDGMIKSSEFQSIATLGLRLSADSWVKQFLEDHRTKILGSMPSEEYYQFTLSHYLYHLKNYEPALKTLLISSYDDMHCKVSAKMLEIKILWEMSRRDKSDERVAEFLENKVEAAIIYFFREKNLPATKKKMGKRFADTMKRIIHAEGKRDVDRLEIILQDIAKAEYIAERQWLTKLVEDLIAQHKKK